MKYSQYEESVLLLGGRETLCYRRQVQAELIEKGFKKIIIMEDIDDKDRHLSLDDKFRNIIDENDPRFIFAFFHNNRNMEGLAFEIGWICCYYKPLRLFSKLRFYYEKNYDWSKASSYITDLFSNIPHYEFDDLQYYSKASTKIMRTISINSK